jgi:Flp pilus assembly pilin Flp
MKQVLSAVGRLVANDDGQDLLEYGLLAVLIAIFAMAAVSTVGKTIYAVFWEVISRGF